MQQAEGLLSPYLGCLADGALSNEGLDVSLESSPVCAPRSFLVRRLPSAVPTRGCRMALLQNLLLEGVTVRDVALEPAQGKAPQVLSDHM